MDRSEQALIRQACRGDERAFAELMRTHRLRVYRVARRILGSHEDAEDATQRVFITMYEKLHTFRGTSQLSTWLYRVTANACYDILRREHPTAELDFDRLPAPAASASDTLISEEAVARISEHVAALPPKQRMTVALRLGEGLPFKEVAAAMGCSVGTAKVNYFHALRRLRAALGESKVIEHAV